MVCLSLFYSVKTIMITSLVNRICYAGKPVNEEILTPKQEHQGPRSEYLPCMIRWKSHFLLSLLILLACQAHKWLISPHLFVCWIKISQQKYHIIETLLLLLLGYWLFGSVEIRVQWKAHQNLLARMERDE